MPQDTQYLFSTAPETYYRLRVSTRPPVVILAHAVDDDPTDIPKEERTDDLVAPATGVTADYIPEERGFDAVRRGVSRGH